MKLSQLTHIKRWQVAHRGDHPIEYHAWDVVLTCWMMGCVSTPLVLLLWPWALPLSLGLCVAVGCACGYAGLPDRAPGRRALLAFAGG